MVEVAHIFFFIWAASVLCIIAVGFFTDIISRDIAYHQTFTHPDTSIWSKYVAPLGVLAWVMMWVAKHYNWVLF